MAKKLSNWNKRVERDHFPKLMAGGAPSNAVPKDISGDKARDNMPQGLKVSFSKFDIHFLLHKAVLKFTIKNNIQI